MTLSRRSTIKTIGVVGAGSALSNSVLAVNQHEDDERDESARSDEAEDEETGAIRVTHFSPDAPAVDVYVNDQQILTDVAYNDVSPYLEIVPGTYTLTVTAAGDEEAVVYEQQINVGSGFYTAAAIGELELEDGADGLGSDDGTATEDGTDDSDDNSSALETDEYGNESAANETDGGYNATDEGDLDGQDVSAAADESRGEMGTFDVLLLVDRPADEVDDAIKGEDAGQVRLVHASPDAPNVAVAVDSGQVLFEDVGFPEPSGYVGAPAGDVTLDIYAAADVDGPVVGKEVDEATGDDSDRNASDTADDGQDDDSDTIGTDAEDEPAPVASVDLEVERGNAYTVYAIGYLESADGAGSEAVADEDAGLGNESDSEYGNASAANETDGGYNATDDETDSPLDSSNETDGESAAEDDRSFDTVVLLDGTMDANDTDDVDDETADEMDEAAGDDAEAGHNESDSEYGNESATNESDDNASDY